MLDLQNSFNSKRDPNWKTSNTPWMDGVWTEATEAFNHTSWEWWKNSGAKPDIEQIKMEVVDIWHFIMSELMTRPLKEPFTIYEAIDLVIKEIAENEPSWDVEVTIEDIRNSLRNLVRLGAEAMLYTDQPEIALDVVCGFYQVMFSLKMDWDELYKLYIGKNTLNSFRQDNGYKTSTEAYKCIWAKNEGKEDNQYLTVLLNTLNIDSATFKEQVYNALASKFKELKNQAS